MSKKHLMICGIAAMAACSVALGQQSTVRLSIQAQPLDKALNAWADQTGYQILIPVDRLVRGQIAPGIEGSYTPQNALEILLAQSNLEFQFVDQRTVALRAADAGASASPEKTESSPRETQATEANAPLVIAQSRPRETEAAGSSAGARSPMALERIEEVIVTAQKRSERLYDVPVPVTAISAGALIERGQARLQDFYTSVPGLSLTTGIGAQDAPILSIRGVTTGGNGFGANPTVAVVVDDVPYGSSTSYGGGNLVPDLDPSDLASIEVLRGPQGTLYGASSLGGLLKYTTVDPSTERYDGYLQAGLVSTHHGDDEGHSLRGGLNLPLGDTFAVRVSGFTRRDPGYIDDPGLGAEGVNRRDSYGGRLSALWQLSDALSLKLSALHQHAETDGSHLSHRLTGLGDLEQRYVLPGLGGYTRDSDVFSATLRAQLGSAELVSISGYAVNDSSSSIDRTSAFGALTQAIFGVPGSRFVEYHQTEKFSQEVRVSFPLGERTDWLVGTFFTRETSDLIQDLEALDPGNGTRVGVPFHSPYETTFEEYAAFADLTYQISDRFDVQIGGRVSRNEQDLNSVFEGEFIPLFFAFPSGFGYRALDTDDTSVTYLLTPRFKVSPDLMVYARFASGYRPGGPQPNATSIGVPPFFEPDTTRNYEIGVKGTLLAQALSFDASVFHIDWDDIQLQLRDPVTTFAYFASAGSARSRGIELAGDVRPWRGMTMSAWGAWTDAELSEDFPPGPALGRSGDRLPFGSRFSGNFSFDQEFAVFGQATGFLGASVSYVGDRLGGFTANGVRQRYASYVQTDARTGLRLEAWTVSLSVNNVTDERGVLAGGLATAQPFAFAYIRPRTYALSLSRTF